MSRSDGFRDGRPIEDEDQTQAWFDELEQADWDNHARLDARDRHSPIFAAELLQRGEATRSPLPSDRALNGDSRDAPHNPLRRGTAGHLETEGAQPLAATGHRTHEGTEVLP